MNGNALSCSASSFNEVTVGYEVGTGRKTPQRRRKGKRQLFRLCPYAKTTKHMNEASLYNTELFTIEISQSTVLSEKISESQ